MNDGMDVNAIFHYNISCDTHVIIIALSWDIVGLMFSL